MKYIKKYESTEYNVGDIVRVKVDGIISDETKEFLESNPGEIIRVCHDHPYPYRVDFIENIPDRKYTSFVFTETEILRKATDEEIELFNLKKETNKYNL